MYVNNDNMVGDALRQGDIISGIHILGAINLTGIEYTKDIRDEVTGWSVHKKPDIQEVMVLSHSCEIARENGVKLTSIILAPLRDINTATEPGKIEELISSNILREGIEVSYLKYFYIQPNDRLRFPNGAVVDFSKLFSVRKNSYNYLLERKILQLTEETASSMSLKFAVYIHRNIPQAA